MSEMGVVLKGNMKDLCGDKCTENVLHLDSNNSSQSMGTYSELSTELLADCSLYLIKASQQYTEKSTLISVL